MYKHKKKPLKDHLIANNVNDFLNKQVNEVSLKVIEQRKSKSVPKINNNENNENLRDNLRQAVSSTQLMTKTRSVRAHALKQHSRQKNTYISASSLKFSINNGLINRDKSYDTSDRSGNSLGIHSNDNPSTILAVDTTTTPKQNNNNQENNPIKKKFNLKLQINDEEDWIQVNPHPFPFSIFYLYFFF